ncbi:MAG: hypothetical protein JWQ34_1041 [Mucilaginibacter sp.]|uniref:DUF4249 family protein n=1 Tax=Mucilaginibacter sp. TaxID=1882438 RepID=UPI0026216D6D|nr:DUF4249 family protein [Mucilaginibacter sp.]MDB5002816.1 hypothetical protein [Mucilaginibacter sp.]
MVIKKHISIIIILLTVTILSACTKDNPDTKSTTLPVIESYLMPGQPVVVKLYQQKSLTDTAVYGAHITGMKVYISDGSQKVQLTESTSGVYTYTNLTFLVTGKTYSLQFNYLGYNVTASTVMPAKPVNFVSQYPGITIVSGTPGNRGTVLNLFSWSNPDSLNHVLVIKGVSATVPVNSFSSDKPLNSQINTNRASYYNLTASPFAYLGAYQIILLRVNQEYINLLNNNTRTSSQDLNQVPTNIVNGFGIFTAMQADTLNFTVL